MNFDKMLDGYLTASERGAEAIAFVSHPLFLVGLMVGVMAIAVMMFPFFLIGLLVRR